MPISDHRIRYFAARTTGVHVIPKDEAVAAIRSAPPTPASLESNDLFWIDIREPADDEAVFLRETLGLHPLAVEDCLRGRQRPKIDRYPGYYVVVFYAARLNPGRARMALNELQLVLGTNFIITVHDREIPEIDQVIATWRMDTDRLSDSGAAAHALFDAVIDGYFPILEHFSDRIDRLEDLIFADSPEPSLQQAILLRHEMVVLRRVLAPERDVLSSLVRRDLPFLRPELVPYFQDVHDHVLRVMEEIDALRELLTGLMEVQTSNASNRLNRTVQTLTAWSIILMTISAIAGIYGMNFLVMPELELAWGYYAVLGLMVVTGVVLLLFFRRRGWL